MIVESVHSDADAKFSGAFERLEELAAPVLILEAFFTFMPYDKDAREGDSFDDAFGELLVSLTLVTLFLLVSDAVTIFKLFSGVRLLLTSKLFLIDASRLWAVWVRRSRILGRLGRRVSCAPRGWLFIIFSSVKVPVKGLRFIIIFRLLVAAEASSSLI